MNKIAFLTFKVTLVDSLKDLYDVKLINTIFANGSLKKSDFTEEVPVEPNYLYYQILGEDQKEKSKYYERVNNPLSMVYEYPGENGTLGKKTIIKNSGEVVIRFKYDQKTKSLVIFKPDQYTLKLKPIYHATL